MYKNYFALIYLLCMLTSAIFTYQILDEGGNGGRHRWNYATLVLAPHLYRAKESNFGE